jgi:diguanylate cyclase (GGDEF)-like protein
VGDRAPLTALIALAVNWPLAVLAVLATLVTVVLLVPMLRRPREAEAPPASGHRERRRAPVAGRREAREALALVGEALAATHNPRALMPVVLNVITEATGARGGRLLHDGEEVGWVGDLDGGGKAVEFDLSAGDDTAAMTLVLNPPEGGFSEETMKLAEWLSSQAAIALENARLHDVVQWQAITDELTGIVNRRRFLDALHSEIARGKRLGGTLSVVLADLDGFKEINDRFGHHAGDEVLIAFAELLQAHGRDVDVAARLGGEEFAVLLPETGLDGARAVADRLCRSLAELQIPLGVGDKVNVTASFGVAELGDSQSVDALLRAADSALYRAKERGKNRVELADQDAA